MNFDDLHQLVHVTPTYEQAVVDDRPLVQLALAPGEINLILLGMLLTLAQFPCLQQEVIAYIDRTQEIFGVQLGWGEDEGEH